MFRSLLIWLFFVVSAFAAPTEVRDWKATSGHTARGSAIAVAGGQVKIRLESGKEVNVPLAKLVADDQEFLRDHFEMTDAPAAGEIDGGAPADDLPHPLGQTTGEIAADGTYHYYLYLPKSLEQGKKHPVVFVMNPGGGGAGTTGSYEAGAERNQWIIAVSKESKNGFAQSGQAISAMIESVKKTLPIDEDRMYLSGFSGGSRMAFELSDKYKGMAGLIPCGAGGQTGSRKQVAYGLCGSNCFNRNDMARSFKEIRAKGSVLRYFEGQHVWAGSELLEDAITHLNGIFLKDNKSDYSAEYARYIAEVEKLIEENKADNPKRAFMWADFLVKNNFSSAVAKAVHGSLKSDSSNQLYVDGLEDVRKFAEKTFGATGGSQSKADPAIAAKCLREAEKYSGTEWQQILKKMAEDAQKF